MNFSVTKNGKELSKNLYTWDDSAKAFSTEESGLVLDFSEVDGVTFNTGHACTFTTRSDCTFTTGDNCTFTTGWNCTFKTGEKCSLTYTWNWCFEVYKLVPNKTVKILKNGTLQKVLPPTKKKISLELTDEQIESLKAQGFI